MSGRICLDAIAKILFLCYTIEKRSYIKTNGERSGLSGPLLLFTPIL